MYSLRESSLSYILEIFLKTEEFKHIDSNSDESLLERMWIRMKNVEGSTSGPRCLYNFLPLLF